MTQPADQAYDLETLIDLEAWQVRLGEIWTWLRAESVSLDFWGQAAAVVIALFIGFAFRPHINRLLDRICAIKVMARFKQQILRFLAPTIGPAAGWMLLSLTLFGFELAERDVYLLRLAAGLVGAWAVIRLISGLIAEPFWARTAAGVAWIVAALNILGWLGPAASFLDSLGMPLGEGRISVLTGLRAILVIGIFYWAAGLLSRLLGARVEKLPGLAPSARILLTKTAQIVLIAIAAMLALSTLNINLGALAIFSGAIGLGIGFGLQKIFSNLVSGVILLLDRSIKPGDVITVDETYGRVSALGMRFAAVVTRDGHEHLIPNEEFITSKVINWTYSNKAVRIKKMIGVDYGTDVPKAMAIIVAATESVDRVLRVPKTRCHLRGFGDNAIDLEVRFWISDSQNGVKNVSSDVLVAIWKAFQEQGVNFPFPQRDLHVKDPVEVRMLPPGD
jgi:small-conductance mechanosensitive channel